MDTLAVGWWKWGKDASQGKQLSGSSGFLWPLPSPSGCLEWAIAFGCRGFTSWEGFSSHSIVPASSPSTELGVSALRAAPDRLVGTITQAQTQETRQEKLVGPTSLTTDVGVFLPSHTSHIPFWPWQTPVSLAHSNIRGISKALNSRQRERLYIIALVAHDSAVHRGQGEWILDLETTFVGSEVNSSLWAHLSENRV